MFNIMEYVGADARAGADESKSGGGVKYDNDHTAEAVKDSTVSKVLPDTVSECIGESLTGSCMRPTTLNKVVTIVGLGKHTAISGSNGDTSVIAAVKEKLDCDTHECVLKALEPKLGKQLVSDELAYIESRKVDGPTDNKLLSNVHIDNVMKVYATLFPGFYPYNFNMSNYASYRFRDGYVENTPDTLATVQFRDLAAAGNTCCGCVINTDKYQGPGQHWMALFADTRGPVWSVEFFNSSGNVPTPEWVNWMVKTKMQMEDMISNMRDGKKPTIEMVKCSQIRHQQSRTECGLYSLFYIYGRLAGIPYEYFMKNPIPDQLMFEFRQHLFNSKRGLTRGEFDWKKYTSEVRVKWE